MRIRVWELAVGVFGLLIALAYFLTGAYAVGTGVGAAVAAGLAARMRPVELPGVAGAYARDRARLEAAQTVSLIVAVLVVMALLIVSALARWSRDPVGLVAVFALMGLEVMLLIELSRRSRDFFNWSDGADSEEAVQSALQGLPSGWLVTHNLLRDRGGNIDHVAVSSTGAFAIETKSHRYRGADGSQALGAAMALRDRLGVSWVTAVVCVPGNDVPQPKGPVWVVGRERLVEWLSTCREHRGPAIDVAAAREALAAAYGLG